MSAIGIAGSLQRRAPRALRRYAVLAPGVFETRAAKTAHGVLAYSDDRTVAVIDPEHAGKRVCDVVPYLRSPAPIVAELRDALRYGPTALLIGVAPPGGGLPPTWRAAILAALEARLEIVSGLHDVLAEDQEFAAAAQRTGTPIRDVRVPPAPRLFGGDAYRVRPCVALFVGSDCAVGKMTAALELTRAARKRGRHARFIATGQTGIMIAGDGIAIDRVISDFASGAAEQLVVEGAHELERERHARHDSSDGRARDGAPDRARSDRSAAGVLFVEGQGGINHPAYAPVTLALLYGCAPDVLVLVHLAARRHIEDFGTPLLSLRRCIELHESLCAAVKPARVCGIALNTYGLDDARARAAVEQTRAETGLPCDDVVRFGASALYDAIAPALTRKTQPLQ